MIYDLNKTNQNHFTGKKYDVCIIGGGVVGITLAEYLVQDASVILLEAGDMDFTVTSQDCYKGKNTGFPYYDLDGCRARYLGGSSNWWGGFCQELSKEDFEIKHNLPMGGCLFKSKTSHDSEKKRLTYLISTRIKRGHIIYFNRILAWTTQTLQR